MTVPHFVDYVSYIMDRTNERIWATREQNIAKSAEYAAAAKRLEEQLRAL